MVIGIKPLTSGFLDIFGSYPNFQRGKMPILSPPCGRPCPHYEKGPATVAKPIIAKRASSTPPLPTPMVVYSVNVGEFMSWLIFS